MVFHFVLKDLTSVATYLFSAAMILLLSENLRGLHLSSQIFLAHLLQTPVTPVLPCPCFLLQIDLSARNSARVSSQLSLLFWSLYFYVPLIPLFGN